MEKAREETSTHTGLIKNMIGRHGAQAARIGKQGRVGVWWGHIILYQRADRLRVICGRKLEWCKEKLTKRSIICA